MKIEQLPSGNYRVRKMIDGKNYTATFKSKPAKKEIEQAFIEKIQSNLTLSTAPKKAFKDCALEYIEVKRNVLSASTTRSYMAIIRGLGDFANIRMSDIDSIAVQKALNNKAAECSPKTIKNYYGFISAVMDMFAPETRLKVTMPKPIKVETYIPTSDEIKRVLSESNDKYYIVFMLGCYGLRRSEILALDYPSDFDTKNCTVSITKSMVMNADQEFIIQNFNKTTESTRKVPISKDLIERIAKQGYVYQGRPDNIIEYLHRKQKQAGVPNFKFHALRHYFATELDQAGFSSKDIQKLGGWSSDHVMKAVYQHNRISKDKEMQRRAADLISGNLNEK